MIQSIAIIDIVALSPLILLAAGKSSRMGSPKGLIDVKGVPLLESQIVSAIKAGVEKVVCVVGFNKEAYAPVLDNIRKKFGEKLLVVENKNPERGQFSSIQTGLAELKSKNVFILPMDTLCASEEVFLGLSKCKDFKAVIPSFEKKGGHPILLSAAFAETLLKLDPQNSRLDFEIKKLGANAVTHIGFDDSNIVSNINDPSDLKL